MLLEIKCSSCGSPDRLIIDENERESVLICKNPECPDFNCFTPIIFNLPFEIKKGLTGELTFENEEGEWQEKYDNGEIISCKKVK